MAKPSVSPILTGRTPGIYTVQQCNIPSEQGKHYRGGGGGSSLPPSVPLPWFLWVPWSSHGFPDPVLLVLGGSPPPSPSLPFFLPPWSVWVPLPPPGLLRLLSLVVVGSPSSSSPNPSVPVPFPNMLVGELFLPPLLSCWSWCPTVPPGFPCKLG